MKKLLFFAWLFILVTSPAYAGLKAVTTSGGGGGSGTVTSITATSPLTGGTITTSGSIGFSNGGPVIPASYTPIGTSANLFPYVYTGAGGNASPSDAGWGVAASLGADVVLGMRFPMPSLIPKGTFNLRSVCLANASSGVVKYTISDADVANGSSPSAATLSGETQTSITWSAADVYVITDTPLTSTPVANHMSVAAVTFNHTSWTLATILECNFYEIWE